MFNLTGRGFYFGGSKMFWEQDSEYDHIRLHNFVNVLKWPLVHLKRKNFAACELYFNF